MTGSAFKPKRPRGRVSAELLDGSTAAIGNRNLLGQAQVVVHVETTGSDDNDGSAQRPFRTPQRALDELPNGFAGFLIVKIGAGSFDFPTLNRFLKDDAAIVLEGSSTEYLDVSSVTSGDFSEINPAVYEAACPAHSGIDPKQHWLGWDLGSYIFGYTVHTTGAGSTIRVPQIRTATFDSGLKLYTFGTTLTVAGNYAVGGSMPTHLYKLFLSGIKVLSSADTFQYCQFQGCYIDATANVAVFHGCYVNSHASGNTIRIRQDSHTSFIGEAEFDCAVEVYGSASINGVFGGNLTIGAARNRAGGDISKAHFQSGASLTVKERAFLQIIGNMSTASTNTSFITATTGARIERSAGVLTTVALQGRLLTLNEGASATGMETFLSGSSNAATPGEEVKVGAAAAQTSASLPATDSTELCRAT